MGLIFLCQNAFPKMPENTSHSSQVHLSYRTMKRAMDFRSRCRELAFKVSQRGTILFFPSIIIDIGTRGSHILILDKAVSLKNIEEFVQDREAIWDAETCPPIRAM